MKRKAFGFTLIELLVVIAIIAMLAAILVPAVNKALISAALTQTVSNGASIYKSAFAGQMESIAVSGSGLNAWPLVGGDFDSSTDYFVDLVTNGSMSVSYNFFSARGLDAARNETEFRSMADQANAWNLVLGLNDASDGTPYLYTQNGPADLPTDDADFELQPIQPFAKDGMVVVQKGGSALSLRGNQTRGDLMNPAGAPAAGVTLEVAGP